MTKVQAQDIVNNFFTFEDAMQGITTFNSDRAVNSDFIQYCVNNGYHTE